jgi:hypothetical protein
MLGATASACSGNQAGSPDCDGEDNRECVRVAACLCGERTCDDVCNISASSELQCTSYAPGFPYTFIVEADDCEVCRAAEAELDEDLACDGIDACLTELGDCLDAGGTEEMCDAQTEACWSEAWPSWTVGAGS